MDKAITVHGLAAIARVCHEVNKALCEAYGDDSQLTWDEAPAWQRTSAVQGVVFHLANPDATPKASHDNWLATKLEDGWTYGPVKDPAKKQHPCMVAFYELPLEQRVKDHVFKAVVHELKNFLPTLSIERRPDTSANLGAES